MAPFLLFSGGSETKNQTPCEGEEMHNLLVAMRSTVVLAALSSFLLSACTTEVKFAPINTSAPIEGVIYHLPSTEITFTPTYQLDQCGPTPSVRIVALQIREDIVPDRSPSATYILNHKGLTDWIKVIESAKVELHPTGILKSVTYKAQDKTRETIKEGFGAAKNIALAASGLPPLPQKMTVVKGVKEFCNVPTLAAIAQSSTIEATIQNLKNKLDTELASFAANPLASTSQTIDLIHVQLDKAIQRLAAVRSHLQISFSVPYLADPKQPLATQIVPEPHTFFKWFNDLIIQNPSDIQQILQMSVTLTRSGRGTFNTCPTTPNAGILYRIPDYYTMRIEHTGRTALVKEIPILQLGCVARFEVKNRPFQNNVHEINFNGNGGLESFHFADNAARAQQLIGTINDIASETGSFESQHLSQQADLDKKKKERLEAERDRLKAERELAEERTKQE